MMVLFGSGSETTFYPSEYEFAYKWVPATPPDGVPCLPQRGQYGHKHELQKAGELNVTRGTIYVRMGEMLGMPMRSEADAWRIVKSGIPTENYVQLVTRLRLTPNAVVSETTLRRRLSQAPAQKGTSARHHVARLNPAETERVMRITRVVAEATELFGTEKAALEWLKNPGDFLGDETQVTPMKLAETDSGARMVELLIQRSANGFF